MRKAGEKDEKEARKCERWKRFTNYICARM